MARSIGFGGLALLAGSALSVLTVSTTSDAGGLDQNPTELNTASRVAGVVTAIETVVVSGREVTMVTVQGATSRQTAIGSINAETKVSRRGAPARISDLRVSEMVVGDMTIHDTWSAIDIRK